MLNAGNNLCEWKELKVQWCLGARMNKLPCTYIGVKSAENPEEAREMSALREPAGDASLEKNGSL